jgi:hypothetical protein
MDSTERRKSNEEENNVIIEEVLQQKDHSIKKTFSTLKEENDKLRTYLGLVKMCNYSAIAKIKSALNETNNTINSLDIDSNLIVKQLEIIQNEITNMQSMHSKLEEGIESFQVIETNTNCNQTNSNTNEESNDQNRETVVLVTTRYEVPRKSTGIRKSHSAKNANKSKSKAIKESSFNAKLLNRIVENKGPKAVPNVQPLQTTVVCSEQQEAVASIDNTSSCEERENVSDGNDVNESVRVKTTKRPYISEEFKTSHFQRLVEAKKRREEMNKQLEREGKRKPKIKRSEDQLKEVGDSPKKSPKKRQTKKKIVGKVTTRKTIKSQPITTAQSIVVPINQSTLDSLSGQTIQIIASGGTQILCRNDGTFIPASNNSWQTANTQWTTTTDNNYSQNQWSQYQT